MIDVVLLIVSLGVILLGATVFTNGLEWFGKKMNLSDGAVGSIFAAVGTALPETIVPLIAILFGSAEAGKHIGVGAIVGAPFMLGTLAFFIAGFTCFISRKSRPDYPVMRVDTCVITRDLEYFLVLYGIAILAAVIGNHPIIKTFLATLITLAYMSYVIRTLKEGCSDSDESHDLEPCYFARKCDDPSLFIIGVQVTFSLLLIIGGAYLFVDKVQLISLRGGISPFILALIIAPIATELPEKFNSIIWILKGKDTLALGNITGAMVFQGSVIAAIGILMTEWRLNPAGYLTAVLTFVSAGLAYIQLRVKKRLTPGILIAGGVFYFIFIVLMLTRSV